MTWGPFLIGLEPGERQARLRSLRALVKVLAGQRGADAAFALLRAEISGGDVEMLTAAADAFERLGAIDRRRVLSNFAALQVPDRQGGGVAPQPKS